MSITLYTAPDCLRCKIVKGFLAEHQIAYETVDFKADAQTFNTFYRANRKAIYRNPEGVEFPLFDDGSATVRLSAFVFLCRLGASSPERSDEVWPLLDEAIQCYHGDAEYRDMLVALLGLARGSASDATRKALAARVSFDAESGSGYIKSFSEQIVQALS